MIALPDTRLHIVSFDVPYPPDYGGAIDVFFKIKALHALGVKVILHAFTYRRGRGAAPALQQYCESVHYYSRDLSPGNMFLKMPFIVASRKSSDLVSRILSDPAPVLLEGWHTCGLLPGLKQAGLYTAVRSHNIESHYYEGLSRHTRSRGKRIYYAMEARKLEAFLPALGLADQVFAISPKDTEYLARHFPHVSYLPVFHGQMDAEPLPGMGQYALYHGNLKVEENSAAVAWLLDKVWHRFSYPLVIAGHGAPAWLRRKINETPGVTLLDPVPDIHTLVRDAHIHVLPAMQDTGIKLKLLHVLFAGRHCLVNAAMVNGTGLEGSCIVSDNPENWQQVLIRLKDQPFTAEEIAARRELLLPQFDNMANARKLMASAGLLP